MDSSYAAPKKQRQGLRNVVKAIFRYPEAHTGPGPAHDHQWGTTAEKPDDLPTIHQAVRDNDIPLINKILQAYPHRLHETDDRKCSSHPPTAPSNQPLTYSHSANLFTQRA